MLKGLKITLFALLAVFSVGFLVDLQIAEASVTSEITVNVESALFQLTVNIDGDGTGNVLSISPSAGVINCGIGTSCSTTYDHGTSVTLKATA
nr:hypothetical protein [Candidatus Paceibacterota bacterium]